MQESPVLLTIGPTTLILSQIQAAKHSEALNALVKFNQGTGNQKYTFTIPESDLVGLITLNSVILDEVINFYQSAFNELPLAETNLSEDAILNIMLINKRLRCMSSTCNLIEQLLTRYFNALSPDQLPYLEIVAEGFPYIPLVISAFLKQLSNKLFQEDSFTPEIIRYYHTLIEHNEQYALALLPRGYPYTRAERIDRFLPTLFLLDPLRQSQQLPDYLSTGELALVQPNAFTTPPPIHEDGSPIVQVPSREILIQRLLGIFPDILRLNEEVGQQLLRKYPAHNAGFIIGGGMLSICLDQWLYQGFADKTDIDLFIYGPTAEARRDVFQILFAWLLEHYPNRADFALPVPEMQRNLTEEEKAVRTGGPGYTYKVERSVLSLIRLKGTQQFALQIINTDCYTASEVLMNFDTSNIQVGYDVYRGFCCTPYFSLYYRKRYAVLIRYNIRGLRLVKSLYRGFSLRTEQPFVLVSQSRFTYYTKDFRDHNKLLLRRDVPIRVQKRRGTAADGPRIYPWDHRGEILGQGGDYFLRYAAATVHEDIPPPGHVQRRDNYVIVTRSREEEWDMNQQVYDAIVEAAANAVVDGEAAPIQIETFGTNPQGFVAVLPYPLPQYKTGRDGGQRLSAVLGKTIQQGGLRGIYSSMQDYFVQPHSFRTTISPHTKLPVSKDMRGVASRSQAARRAQAPIKRLGSTRSEEILRRIRYGGRFRNGFDEYIEKAHDFVEASTQLDLPRLRELVAELHDVDPKEYEEEEAGDVLEELNSQYFKIVLPLITQGAPPPLIPGGIRATLSDVEIPVFLYGGFILRHVRNIDPLTENPDVFPYSNARLPVLPGEVLHDPGRLPQARSLRMVIHGIMRVSPLPVGEGGEDFLRDLHHPIESLTEEERVRLLVYAVDFDIYILNPARFQPIRGWMGVKMEVESAYTLFLDEADQVIDPHAEQARGEYNCNIVRGWEYVDSDLKLGAVPLPLQVQRCYKIMY
jgi:hypothetical protein